MKPSFIFFILSFFFWFLSCERSTTPISSSPVSLTLEYVGVTEAELRLQIDSSQPEDSYELLRDGQPAMLGPLRFTDTTLVDTPLLPAHTYTYQAILIRGAVRSTPSPELTITTLDTTSHDFQWDTFTIESPYGSAALYDVAIIDENNIWAVGRIYADSTEPWVPYNAVHWDGQHWELKRIQTNSLVGYGFYPIKTIFAFDSDNIWMFSDVGSYCHWDGTNWESQYVPQRQGGINEIWGSFPSDIFFVGTNGNITHYDGNWLKFESGTNLDIQDIWGVVDWKTGKVNILAAACNLFSNNGNAVLQIAENSVNLISNINLPENISSVWSWKGREWYICGSGLFKTRNFDMPWEQISDLPSVFQQKVRGSGPNDIFIVGHFGLVLHWNGSTWRQFSGIIGRYSGLAIHNDLVVAVGVKTNGIVAGDGIILVGRRN